MSWKKRALAAALAGLCLLSGCSLPGRQQDEGPKDTVDVSDAYFGLAWYKNGTLNPVTGIINERAALVAVHRRVHGFPPYHSSEPSSGMTSFMAVIATSIIESSGSNTVRCWIMRPGQRSAREMTLSERPA